MTLDEAIEMMKAGRPKEKNVRSVLNPTLCTIQAWNIVWTALIQTPDDATWKRILDKDIPAWLEKRVRQVCTNQMDPSIDPVVVKAVLELKDAPADPFAREFS